MSTATTSGSVPRPQPIFGTKAFVEHTMGMAISLHVRAIDVQRADITAAAQEAFAQLRRADSVFSTYQQDSDVMRLRRGEIAWEGADPWLRNVRDVCLSAQQVTNGLFATDLVGPDGSRGWDPTGVVKGWAVERAADILRAVPGIRFCLNAGGDLIADQGLGLVPDAVDAIWHIGIADPADPQRVLDVIEISRGALATSGTAQRGAHIIDPRTGAPAATERRSITVIGPELTWADMWATVCFIDPMVLPFSRMAASYYVAHTIT